MITRLTFPIEPGVFNSGQQPWLDSADVTLVPIANVMLKVNMTDMEVTNGK